MKRLVWDPAKSKVLKQTRGVSFEDVVFAIQNDRLLTVLNHPNKQKYGHQKMFVVEIDSYAYVIPFVEDDRFVFLKTVFPSRKLTKLLLK